MKPHERLTQQYNLDLLAGVAIREIEARQIVDSLDPLFPDDAEPRIVSGPIKATVEEAFDLVAGTTGHTSATTLTLTPPYENFEHNGISFQSQLMRAKSRETNDILRDAGYLDKSIYFLGLVPEGQNKITLENVRFGVVRNEQGQHIFFGVTTNRSESGKTEGVVHELEPADEMLVVEELKKAVALAA